MFEQRSLSSQATKTQFIIHYYYLSLRTQRTAYNQIPVLSSHLLNSMSSGKIWKDGVLTDLQVAYVCK
jgi:hypothetical protein